MRSPLRKCTSCGEIATDKVALELFAKSKDSKYGRYNLCKLCANIRSRKVHVRYQTKNPTSYTKYMRAHQRKSTYLRRIEIMNHYGGKCTCCGENELKFLSIDHINGNGRKHRQQIKINIYSWLKKNKYPTGFQILCYNCNLSKGFYGQCPHKE